MESKSSTGGFKSTGSLSTNTILLSRKKMGMGNLPRKEQKPSNNFSSNNSEEKAVAAPVGQTELPPAKRMSATTVWCPKCDSSFEITSELYGILAECSECGMEFQIPTKPTEETTQISIQAPPRMNRPGSRRTSTKKRKSKGSSQTMMYAGIIIVLIAILLYALFFRD
jgi:DNA-directed RNA polymerase subunit M/transcription elongation factor TFIIS